MSSPRRRRSPTGIGSQQGVRGAAGGRSVVKLALARLVDEAALVLGSARTALAGSVLSLHRLGAQRVALRSPSGRAASGSGEGGPGSSTMVLPVT